MPHPEIQQEHIKQYISSVTLSPEESAQLIDGLLLSPYAESPDYGIHGDSLYFIKHIINTGVLLAGSNDEGLKGIYLTPIQRNPYTGQDVRESMRWYARNNAFSSALIEHTQHIEVREIAPLLVDVIIENDFKSVDDLYRHGDSIALMNDIRQIAPHIDLDRALSEAMPLHGYGFLINHKDARVVPGDYIEDYVVQDPLPYTAITKILTYSNLDHERLMALL